MNFLVLRPGTDIVIMLKIILAILLFNFPLISIQASNPNFERTLLQVEYSLMENDTQQALRYLNWLLVSSIDENLRQRCQLRKQSLTGSGDMVASPAILVDSLQGFGGLPQLIRARRHLLLGEWSSFSSLIHQLTPLSGRERETPEENIHGYLLSTQQLFYCYEKIIPLKYQDIYFSFLAQEHIRFGTEIMQDKNLATGNPVRILQNILADLLDETIRQLFLSFFDPDTPLNPFYLQFNHYRNLLTFNRRRQVYYSDMLQQCAHPRLQRRLEELYELNYLLLERAGASGLINKDRKRRLTDQLQLNEKILLHFADQYQLTKTDDAFEKLWKVTDMHKNLIWLQKKRFYGTPGLLKEMGRSIIYEIEKTEQEIRELSANDRTETFINLQIYLSKRYQTYLRIFHLLAQPPQARNSVQFDRFRKLITRNQYSVITYTESEHFFLGIYLDLKKKKFKIIPKDSSLIKALTAGKEQFSRIGDLSGVQRKDLTTFYEHAHVLYNRLLGTLLGEHIPPELLIVPDGKLCYLPFGTLVVNLSGPDRLDPEYLIQFSRVRYYPSAKRLVKASSSSIGVKAQDLLTVAPDYSTSSYPHPLYPDLRGSRREIAAITRLFPRSGAVLKACKKEALLRQDRQPEMVHFSMHGTHRENGLVFPADSQSVLMPYELANLAKAPAVVVIGACYSGLGEYIPGEGLESIGHKFLEIGTGVVLAGLSALEDRVSADILSGFYQFMANGYSGAEALQKAKIQYLQQADTFWQQPFLWGGMVFYGEDFQFY